MKSAAQEQQRAATRPPASPSARPRTSGATRRAERFEQHRCFRSPDTVETNHEDRRQPEVQHHTKLGPGRIGRAGRPGRAAPSTAARTMSNDRAHAPGISRARRAGTGFRHDRVDQAESVLLPAHYRVRCHPRPIGARRLQATHPLLRTGGKLVQHDHPRRTNRWLLDGRKCALGSDEQGLGALLITDM